MKHSTGKGENCAKIKKDNPNSDIHLAGSKEIKKPIGKPVKLAGATKGGRREQESSQERIVIAPIIQLRHMAPVAVGAGAAPE